MDKLKILGKSKLSGSIVVPASKNASLPIMVSSLLSSEGLYINNLPNLEDIRTMTQLLKKFNVKIKKIDSKIFFDSSKVKNNIADYDQVRKMRASILVLGPLLTRFGEAKISLPGGCAIGNRPINIHLEAFKKMGAKIKIENGFVLAKIQNQLKGSNILLPFPSVGATENIMMAACLAKDQTIIDNAAKEPEIIDLANCLNKMGAKISFINKGKIKINGVKKLFINEHNIIPDRIVAGTFVIAAVMLNSEFVVNNIDSNYLINPIKTLKNMGAKIETGKNYIKVLPAKKIRGTKIQTKPYPGFPTDLQAQIMALMAIAEGNSEIQEKIFENRFMHVLELNRLGANITIKDDKAFIKGVKKLKGAQVMASDLRASVSLVLAGLCAEGQTIINRVYHLDRGYEKIEETLGKCGPIITRLK